MQHLCDSSNIFATHIVISISTQEHFEKQYRLKGKKPLPTSAEILIHFLHVKKSCFYYCKSLGI